MDIYSQAKKHGQTSAANQGVLPKLGLDAMRAAVNRQLTADDARKLYETYYKASRQIATLEYDTGMKANVSKLRQLILLGERHRKAAIELMERAERVYNKLAREEPCRAFYPYLVEVARTQLAQTRPLTDADLHKLARKPRR